YPRTGVIECQQKNVITTSGPFGEIVGGKDCVNLGSRKVSDVSMRSTPKNTFESGPARKPLMIVSACFSRAWGSLTTPLLRQHINPFGRYHFNFARMRQDGGPLVEL